MSRFYQLALNGKKTILRVKKPTVWFKRKNIVEHIEECADLDKVVYTPKFFKNKMPGRDSYALEGKNWFHSDLFGNKAIEPEKPAEGNVVLGFTSKTQLMLDVDNLTQEETCDFAECYGRFQDLGSSLVLKTSDTTQTDLFGNNLGKFCIIFGKYIHWTEIQWHITEARRLGMIERAFTLLRSFGSITIRVNAKNEKTPAPKIVKFFPNGDMRAIRDYVRFWNRYKTMGFER